MARVIFWICLQIFAISAYGESSLGDFRKVIEPPGTFAFGYTFPLAKKSVAITGVATYLRSLLPEGSDMETQEIVEEWLQHTCRTSRPGFVKDRTLGMVRMPRKAWELLQRRVSDPTFFVSTYDEVSKTWIPTTETIRFGKESIVLGILPEQSCSTQKWQLPVHVFAIEVGMQVIVPTSTTAIDSFLVSIPKSKISIDAWESLGFEWLIRRGLPSQFLQTWMPPQIVLPANPYVMKTESGTVTFHQGVRKKSLLPACGLVRAETDVSYIALQLLSFARSVSDHVMLYRTAADDIPETFSLQSAKDLETQLAHMQNHELLLLSDGSEVVVGKGKWEAHEAVLPEAALLWLSNVFPQMQLSLPSPQPLVDPAVPYPILPKRVNRDDKPMWIWVHPPVDKHPPRLYGFSILDAARPMFSITLPHSDRCPLYNAVQPFPMLRVKTSDRGVWVTAILCGGNDRNAMMVVNVTDGDVIRCGGEKGDALFFMVAEEDASGVLHPKMGCSAESRDRAYPIRHVIATDTGFGVGSDGGGWMMWHMAQPLSHSTRPLFLGNDTSLISVFPASYSDPYNAFEGFGYSTYPHAEMLHYFLSHPKGLSSFLGEVRTWLPWDQSRALAIETPCVLCDRQLPRSVLHRLSWGSDANTYDAFQLLPFFADSAELSVVQSPGKDIASKWLTRISEQGGFQRTPSFVHPVSGVACDWGSPGADTICKTLRRTYSNSASFVVLAPTPSEGSLWTALLLEDVDFEKMSQVATASGACQSVLAPFLADPRLWRVVDFVAWGSHPGIAACVQVAIEKDRFSGYETVVRYIGEALQQQIPLEISKARSLSNKDIWGPALKRVAEVLPSYVMGNIRNLSDPTRVQEAWFGVRENHIVQHTEAIFGVRERGFGFSPDFWIRGSDQLQVFQGQTQSAGMSYASRDGELRFWVPESRSTYHYRRRPMWISGEDSVWEFWDPLALRAEGTWSEGRAYASFAGELLQTLSHAHIPVPTMTETWNWDVASDRKLLMEALHEVKWWPGRRDNVTLSHIVDSHIRSAIYAPRQSYVPFSMPSMVSENISSLDLAILDTARGWKNHVYVSNPSDDAGGSSFDGFVRQVQDLSVSPAFWMGGSGHLYGEAMRRQMHGLVWVSRGITPQGSEVTIPISSDVGASGTDLDGHIVGISESDIWIGWINRVSDTGKYTASLVGRNGMKAWEIPPIEGTVWQVLFDRKHTQVCRKNGVPMRFVGGNGDMPVILVRQKYTGATPVVETLAAPLSAVVSGLSWDEAQKALLCGGEIASTFLSDR